MVSLFQVFSVFSTISILNQAAIQSNPYDVEYSKYTNNFEISSFNKSEYYSEHSQVPDNSIDEDSYYIGSGDEFNISVIGGSALNYKGEIDLNNNLLIPELGFIKLGKSTLAEAKIEIEAYLKKKLMKSETIYVSISGIKRSTICVNGKVSSPGSYVLSGSMRLLDAIKIANEQHLPSLSDCDYRAIKCRTKDSTFTYDLLKYILKNDLSQNPYIYPGDNIFIEGASQKIYLNGPVISTISGYIPIKKHETIGEFLSLLEFSESADTSEFLLQTLKDNDRMTLTLNFHSDSGYVLHDRDVVSIQLKKNYPEIMTSSVTGEIARPGDYPILKGKTSAKELIEFAGGISDFGNLNRAVILRNGKSFKENNLARGELGSKMNLIRPEMSSAMTTMSQANDFAVIQLKKNMDTKLEPGDQVFVPKKECFVYLSGGVKNPGGYSYSPDKNFNYYILLAGGLNKNADKSNFYVIRRYGDIMQTLQVKEIQEGDLLVVPISQQNKQLSTVILPVFQAIATTVSVILAIYATYATAKN